MLNNEYAKFCNPSEYLTVNKITVLFKGRGVLKQYSLKKHFGIKMFKLCNYWVQIWYEGVLGKEQTVCGTRCELPVPQ